MAARHIRLVMAREALDYRRQRKVWRRLFVQPILIVLLLAVPVLLIQRAEAGERRRTITVAVAGDVGAVPGLAVALGRSPLRMRPASDPARAVVASTAHAGVVVPADARRATEAGQPVPLQLLVLPTESASRAGAALVARRLAILRAEQASLLLEREGAPATLATPFALTATDLATRSASGTRFGLGQALPPLLVIQLFGLMSTAEERVAGAKDRRVLEPLLVLPFRRRDVVLGIGATTLTIGFLAAAVVLVPIIVVLATTIAAVTRTVAGPLEVAGAMVLGALLLGTFFTGVGLYAGARAHSGGEGSTFVTVAQVGVFAMVAASPFLADLSAHGPAVALPVLGPMLLVREGVAGGLTVTPVLVALASALVVGHLLLARTTRLLDAEVSVLRASR